MRIEITGHLAAALLIGCSSTSGRFAGLASAIERGEVPKTTSVLVMRAGKIEHEAYFDGAGPDTLHDTRSVGKSITTLAVGIAIGEGVLPGVDATVFDHFGDTATDALKESITVEDLLTMSSALDCNDDDEKSPGNEESLYPLPNWTRWAADIPTDKSHARDASGRGRFRYCTAGVFLLGQLVQRAAKEPIDEFMAKRLFAPLGIERWEFLRSASNEVFTGGGLRLTTRDLAKLGGLIRSRGAFDGKQIVPADFMTRALIVHRHPSPDVGYGYLLWHRTFHTRCGDHPAWYMSGNGGNVVAIIDDLDAVVVVTRTYYNMGSVMREQTTSLIEQHILPELCAKVSVRRRAFLTITS